MRKIIMASITAVVVIAVLAGTLIPVLDDATTTQKTFLNSGYYDMIFDETDGELTAFWDHTTPTEITINGEQVALPSTVPSFNLTLIAGDDWVVRYGADHSISIWGSSGGAIGASVANSTDITITASGGTMTATTSDSSTTTKSYTSIYYVSDSGDYVMKDSNTRAYVLKDSDIHAIGMTYLGSPIDATVQCIFDGTVEDGITGTVNRAGDGATISDIVIDSKAVDGYDDLYTVGSITGTVTNSSGSVGVNYSAYIVPAEVTAEKTVHFTDGENAILNAIPVIVIVALLLGVVALVLRSRMD